MTNTKTINYHKAYAFADAVVSVVRYPGRNGFEFEVLPDFWGFRNKEFFKQIQKPKKKTLLHNLIYELNYSEYEYFVDKSEPDEYLDDCQALLDSAHIPHPTWLKHGQVEDYISELMSILRKASVVVTEAAFQLLFSDRTFLFEFNQMVAKHITLLKLGEHPCVIADGKVKRASYLPVWLKNAIFFRDKGYCQLCGKDLRNVFVPTSQRNIDHMVPLNAHGTNDPTNFQLTCESCNKSKGGKILVKEHLSYPFW